MAKIKMGMVGGGEGAFIGAVHRAAANLDGEIELVCGAFSSDPDKCQRSGEALHIDNSRCYANYQTMMEVEAALAEEERMDFVVIVTPNHLHYPVSLCALENGFHVLCDKPVTFSLEEALKLKAYLKDHPQQLFGVTYTYSGYPLVHEAKARIAKGELGKVRKIIVEYTQGWLSAAIEKDDQKQAAWRLDPKQSGISSCMGDIGVHAAHLSEFISGQKITELCADLTTFVDGRNLEDDGSVLLKYDQGAKGALTASQICFGEENNLSIRIYGEKGSLGWQQQNPNSLSLQLDEQAVTTLRAAGPQLQEQVTDSFRTPSGHPEGYIEAFANIYRNFAGCLRVFKNSGEIKLADFPFPSLEEGVRGMAFIEACVASANSEQKWYPFPKVE